MDKLNKRVLHIFPPNVKYRFSGQVFLWRRVFPKWSIPTINHLILDYDLGKLVDYNTFFNDFYLKDQNNISRISRFFWIFKLLFLILINFKKIDILHVHVSWWGGLLLGLLGKILNKPTLYESVLLGSDTPPSMQLERYGKLKVKLFRLFTGILAISDHLGNEFKVSGFREDKVFVLVNPVDLSIFSPVCSEEKKKEIRSRFSLPEDSIILSFVGSIIKRKGVDILIDAIITITDVFPNLFLLIIGPQKISENPSIDESFVNELKNKLLINAKCHHVKFLGLVQDNQLLSDYYKASDIFLFPSRNEGLGNVVLEAMASGLPVIVSDLPVLQSIIFHEENGLIVPQDDSRALTKAISKLVNNDEIRKSIGQSGNLFIKNNFSLEKWQIELTKIYDSLINL